MGFNNQIFQCRFVSVLKNDCNFVSLFYEKTKYFYILHEQILILVQCICLL